MLELHERIGADHIIKLRFGILFFQKGQSIHRIDDARALQLQPGRHHGRLLGNGGGNHAIAVLCVYDTLVLVRRIACGKEEHLVQIFLRGRCPRHVHVSLMDGIKRAAHDTDAFLSHRARTSFCILPL